jgi:hypothetical protein
MAHSMAKLDAQMAQEKQDKVASLRGVRSAHGTKRYQKS